MEPEKVGVVVSALPEMELGTPLVVSGKQYRFNGLVDRHGWRASQLVSQLQAQLGDDAPVRIVSREFVDDMSSGVVELLDEKSITPALLSEASGTTISEALLMLLSMREANGVGRTISTSDLAQLESSAKDHMSNMPDALVMHPTSALLAEKLDAWWIFEALELPIHMAQSGIGELERVLLSYRSDQRAQFELVAQTLRTLYELVPPLRRHMSEAGSDPYVESLDLAESVGGFLVEDTGFDWESRSGEPQFRHCLATVGALLGEHDPTRNEEIGEFLRGLLFANVLPPVVTQNLVEGLLIDDRIEQSVVGFGLLHFWSQAFAPDTNRTNLARLIGATVREEFYSGSRRRTELRRRLDTFASNMTSATPRAVDVWAFRDLRLATLDPHFKRVRIRVYVWLHEQLDMSCEGTRFYVRERLSRFFARWSATQMQHSQYRNPFKSARTDSEGKVYVSKTGRNDLCQCGSGRKMKRCCWPLRRYSAIGAEMLAREFDAVHARCDSLFRGPVE